MIFWALEERKKRRERNRAELEAEIQARAEAQARERLRAETAQRYESWLAKVAVEKGIPLADLLPPPEHP